MEEADSVEMVTLEAYTFQSLAQKYDAIHYFSGKCDSRGDKRFSITQDTSHSRISPGSGTVENSLVTDSDNGTQMRQEKI